MVRDKLEKDQVQTFLYVIVSFKACFDRENVENDRRMESLNRDGSV